MRVRIVERRGRAALVEWPDDAGRLRRAVVPGEIVVDNEVDVEVLDRGVEYGVPWEEIVGALEVTPEHVAAELRRRGVWTTEDARRNPQVAAAALQAACGLGLAALLGAAREFEEGASWTH